jgi:hypothetical protein
MDAPIPTPNALNSAPCPKAPNYQVTLVCTVGRIIVRRDNWAVFAISAGGFRAAEGNIPVSLRLEKGTRVRIEGVARDYRGQPQLHILRIEELPPDHHDANSLALSRRGVTPAIIKKLSNALGLDFIALIAANPKILNQALPRQRQTTRDKIARACNVVAEMGAFRGALLQAGLPNDRIETLIETFNPTKNSAYSLIFNESISFNTADKLARTPYFKTITPFSPDSADRIAGALAQVLNEARRNGHCGASVSEIADIVAKQFSFDRTKILQVAMKLSEHNYAFTQIDGISYLWDRRLFRNEQTIADAVVASTPLTDLAPQRARSGSAKAT